MAKTALNIGLVGYGFMGRAHSNAFRQAERFFDLPFQPVLKAICARNQDRAQAFASWWGYDAIRIVDPDGNELLFPLDETNDRELGGAAGRRTSSRGAASSARSEDVESRHAQSHGRRPLSEVLSAIVRLPNREPPGDEHRSRSRRFAHRSVPRAGL